MRKEGITLLALVITVIVLIILAGVSINLFMDEYGVITKAVKAREESRIAELTEKLELVKGPIQIDKHIVTVDDYLQKVQQPGVVDFSIDEIARVNEYNAYIVVDVKYEFLLEYMQNGNLKITYKGHVGDTDRTKPIITSTEVTSRTIKIEATDEASGIIGYTISTKDIEPTEFTKVEEATLSFSITIAVEVQGIDYWVWVKDAAGNVSLSTKVTIPYESVSTKLKVGDYVTYTPISQTYTIPALDTGYSSDQTFNTENATNLWQVLYNDSTYGTQITSSKSVGTLNIGTSGNVSKARDAYNNFINTLNNISIKYINTDYATSARSIGSNPSNPKDAINSLYTIGFSCPTGSYTGFKVSDSYYKADETAMKNAISQNSSGITNINENYFIASRNVYADNDNNVVFYLGYVSSTGVLTKNGYYMQGCSDGAGLSSSFSKNCSSGVRPVVTLIDDVKVIDGKGTKDEPYILQPQQ